jgi:hypothetical protein
MHIDLLHAAITAAIMLAVLFAMRACGITKDPDKRFDWRLFAVLLVVLFIFNMIWPAST